MNRLTCSVVACAVLVQLPGCATKDDGSTSRVGQGAMTGALVGGLLGALAGGDRKSVLVGAAAGAAVGAIIGNYQDRQIASRAEAAQRYAVSQQPRLEVESSTNRPGRVSPGSTVESQVGYTVLAPSITTDVKVTESRTLVRGSERFALSSREVVRPQGTHLSTLKFTLPKDLAAGDYTLVTTVASGALSRTVQSPLSVG